MTNQVIGEGFASLSLLLGSNHSAKKPFLIDKNVKPDVLIRAISRVRQFSAHITGDDFETTRKYLEQCNAFKESDGHILRF